MTFDLIGAVELTLCAAVVVSGLALGIGATVRTRVAIILTLFAWFALVTTIGGMQVLHSIAPDPLQVRLHKIAGLGISIMVPIILLSTATLTIKSLRQGLLAMPLWGLVAVNATRVLGVSFLILYAQNRLPAPFAPVAGWGDVFVGLCALPLAWFAAEDQVRARTATLIWNALGLADLIAAVGLGVTASITSSYATHHVGSSTMTLLPWLFIPGFLVPLLATSHLAIFYKLARGANKAVDTKLFQARA